LVRAKTGAHALPALPSCVREREGKAPSRPAQRSRPSSVGSPSLPRARAVTPMPPPAPRAVPFWTPIVLGGGPEPEARRIPPGPGQACSGAGGPSSRGTHLELPPGETRRVPHHSHPTASGSCGRGGFGRAPQPGSARVGVEGCHAVGCGDAGSLHRPS